MFRGCDFPVNERNWKKFAHLHRFCANVCCPKQRCAIKVPERNSSQERRRKPQDTVVSAMSSRDFAGLASVSPDHPLLVAGSRPRFSICHFDSGKQVVLRVLMRSVFPLASGACHSSQFPKVPGASLAILMHASRTRRHGYDREST